MLILARKVKRAPVLTVEQSFQSPDSAYLEFVACRPITGYQLQISTDGGSSYSDADTNELYPGTNDWSHGFVTGLSPGRSC